MSLHPLEEQGGVLSCWEEEFSVHVCLSPDAEQVVVEAGEDEGEDSAGVETGTRCFEERVALVEEVEALCVGLEAARKVRVGMAVAVAWWKRRKVRDIMGQRHIL